MGLESRDYVRDGSYTDRLAGWGLEPLTPVVKYLIIANVIVFLLQIFVTRSIEEEAPDGEQPQRTAQETAQEWSRKVQQQYAELRVLQDDVAKANIAVKRFKGEQAELDRLKADLAQKEVELKQKEREVEETQKEFTQRYSEGYSFGFRPRVSIVQEWFDLNPQKVKQGQVWRLLTSAFCHAPFTPWHIVMNMVLLYWFGRRLEIMYGSREFFLFYLLAALCSSAAYVGLALYTGSKAPAIGASGAVMGVMMLYVIYYPFERFMLFWFIPVPLWVLLAFYVIYDVHPVLLALAGLPLNDGIAHAGHLGGLIFGCLYYKFGLRLETVFGQKWKGTRPVRKAWRPRPRPLDDEPALLPFPKPDALRERLDEVLKKISEQGKESLTQEEREVLIQASEKFRNKK